MSWKKLAVALSLTTSFSALAFHHGQTFHKQSLQLKADVLKSMSLNQEVLFYNQKLDHSDPNSVTFKQRYFIDSQYATDSNSPVFYIICGEWNCAGTGSYSFAESLAKNLKAHLVALEHRFYGESLPTTKLTTGALATLNIESAIEDLASVQRFLMKTRDLKGKWVSFGGSYAGTLSAFYREKHPELVSGALASSAPVLMKNEFSEYDGHIAKVINKTTCGDKVREAVKLIEQKLSTPAGAAEVKKIFKATELKNDGDFLYVVADMLASAVQYGRDKVFCDAINKNTDLVQGYATGGLAVLTSMGNTPYEISLAVAEKLEVTADDNMRQWMWQSCTQFGWFQVANGTGADSARSSKIDLEYHDQVCQRLYGVKMGVDGALNHDYYFPLFNPETSKIIFSNGSNDPWSTLSVTTDSDQSNRAFDMFMMEGAAHCNDLTLATKLPSVMAAHTSMETIIKKWIK